jgi:DNA polymerase-3 subunit epsilon
MENDLILFWDTETQGIPLWREKSEDERQPHIVQLAAKLVDRQSKQVLDEMDVIIKPDGWTIPQEVIDIHGITNEIANEQGIPEADAIDQFHAMWRQCSLRVAHNTTFDNRIIRIGFKRHFPDLVTDEEWKEKSKYYCTLINFRKLIGGKSGHTLGEAYKYFTGKELEGAHNAMNDVDGCMEVYFGLTGENK